MLLLFTIYNNFKAIVVQGQEQLSVVRELVV